MPARPAVDEQAISRAIGFDISQWPETAPKPHPRTRSTGRRHGKDSTPPCIPISPCKPPHENSRITDLQVLQPWSKPWHEPETYASGLEDDSARLLVEKLIYGLVFLLLRVHGDAQSARRDVAIGAAHGGCRWSIFILMGARLVVHRSLGGRHIDDRDLRGERRRLVHIGNSHLAAIHRPRTIRARALAALHPDLEPRAGRPLAGCASGRARPLRRAGRPGDRGLLPDHSALDRNVARVTERMDWRPDGHRRARLDWPMCWEGSEAPWSSD